MLGAPNFPITVAASASIFAVERTSSSKHLSVFSFVSLSAERSVAITLAPSNRKASAIAKPMPCPAAVTNANLPLSRSLTQPDLSVIVPRNVLLCNALIFNGRLEHHSIGQLVDHGALNFLPRRLARGICKAAALFERRPPPRELYF